MQIFGILVLVLVILHLNTALSRFSVILPPLLLGLLLIVPKQRRHSANAITRVFPLQNDDRNEGTRVDFSNPYNNPLIGAPASHTMALPKKTVKQVASEGMKRDGTKKTADAFLSVNEIDMFDHQFLQMPDPTLMGNRVPTFTNADVLPNETLVVDRDFFGATASNQMSN
jgi:hypothetical protein